MTLPASSAAASASAARRRPVWRPDLRPGEGRAVGWALVYVLALFLAYYVLRPLRDELGAAGGVHNLPWLFTGTLAAMLALSPLFGWLVQRWPRERFMALAYRFFALNLLLFAPMLLLADDGQRAWVGRGFFIWVSVFNLFVVSVFWSLMVDVFSAEQGKRLFGLLAAGATAGGMAGSALVAGLARVAPHIDAYWLLLMAAALLEVAVLAARRLLRWQALAGAPVAAPTSASGMEGSYDGDRIGGSVWAGLVRTLRSPYLLGISAFILLYTVTSTLLYFEQANLANAHFADRAERTAFFARIDLWVNALTLALQLFATAALTRRLGVGAMLCALPLLSAAGFALLAAWPSAIGLFVAVQVARRVSNFAFAKPTREVLFTAVAQEDRYKAKNFIDTAIYRSGDQIGSWGHAALAAAGLGLAGMALLAVPLCLSWAALALWLGRRQGTMGHARLASASTAGTASTGG